MSSGPESRPAADVCLVVPCYNEAARLDTSAFLYGLEQQPGLRLLFVDDGSTDDTGRVLEELRASAQGRIDVLPLDENRGKAEAVRCGMLRALDSEPDYAGYWDADLATPLGEVPGFVERMEFDSRLELVMGARVKLLGRTIVRNPVRHYLGRIFATCVSIVLRLAVYDTQCGAKLFRADPEQVRPLFGDPFRSTWIFDVELLARLIRRLHETGGPPVEDVVYEYPLTTWRDIEGSKLSGGDFLRSAWELARIWQVYRPGAVRGDAPAAGATLP